MLVAVSLRAAPRDPRKWGSTRKGMSQMECALADRREVARKAQETTLRGFEEQVDPDGKLSPAERRSLALDAYREHMSKLATKSGRARRARRREREVAQEAEALSRAQQLCGHVWPDVLDVDSTCIYCELAYGAWELPGGAA